MVKGLFDLLGGGGVPTVITTPAPPARPYFTDAGPRIALHEGDAWEDADAVLDLIAPAWVGATATSQRLLDEAEDEMSIASAITVGPAGSEVRTKRVLVLECTATGPGGTTVARSKPFVVPGARLLALPRAAYDAAAAADDLEQGAIYVVTETDDALAYYRVMAGGPVEIGGGGTPVYPIAVGGSPIAYLTLGGPDDYLNIARLFTSPPGTVYALASASLSLMPNSWLFDADDAVLITDTSLVVPEITLTFEATYQGRTVSQTLSFARAFVPVQAKGQPADLALTVGTAMTPVDLGALFNGDRPLTIDAAPGYAALPSWMTLTAATVNGEPTTLLGGTPTAALAATTFGFRARNTDPEGTIHEDSVSFSVLVQAANAVPVFTRAQALVAESTVVGARVYRSPGPIIAPADTPVVVDWFTTPTGIVVATDALTLPPEATIIAGLTGTEILAPAEAEGRLIRRRTRGLDAQGNPVVANVSPPVGPFTAAVVAPTALGGVAVPDLTVGVDMTAVDFNAAFGGSKPQTLTLDASSDALPAGLSFTDGVLSGRPSAADAAVNLVVRATNSAGFVTVSDSFVIAAASAVPFTTYVPQLRDRTRPNGRTSTATLFKPTDVTIPGMSVSGSTVTFSSYSGDPLDYYDLDFRDFAVVVNTVLPAFRQCMFGQTIFTAAPTYPLRINGTGDIDTIEYCDFVRTQGPGWTAAFSTFIYQVPTGNSATGQMTAYGKLRRVYRCRFDGAQADCLKILGDARAGGQIFEECYFGRPQNLPTAGTSVWSATTSYPLNFIVHRAASNGTLKYWTSRVANNLNHPLPLTSSGGPASDDYWLIYDPHADAVTVNASVGEGVEFFHCLFDWTDRLPGQPTLVQNGITNFARVHRDTDVAWPMGRVEFTENVCYYTQGDDGYPIHVGTGDDPNWTGPIRFTNNRLQPNKNGAYFHEDTNGLVAVWANNRSLPDDTLIPGPTGASNIPVDPDEPDVTFPDRISYGLLGRSNFAYLTLTHNGANYQSSLIARPNISDPNRVRFVGQNEVSSVGAIFEREISNVSGSMDVGINTERNSNRGIQNIAMMTVAEYLIELGNQEGWTTKFDLVDLAFAGRSQLNLLNDEETAKPWLWQTQFLDIIARVGREIDRIIQKWDWESAGDLGAVDDKRAYLRLANAPAPAGAFIPTGLVDHTFWDLNLPAGTKGGANPPAFSTNTKLSIVPEDSAALRNRLKAMMTDEDWLKILKPKFLGRFDSCAADGGHPYSDAVSGQVLGAMTLIIPHIIADLHERGMVDTDLVSPERVGWTVAANRLTADLYIEQANGGSLYTPRETWGIPFPSNPRADQQPYNGIFIQRAGEAESATGPIMRVGSSSFVDPNPGENNAVITIPSAANHQGTVSLISRGTTVPSVTLTDGTVVTNGRFAQLRVTFPAGYPLATGDRLHTFRNWWAWVDNGNDPISQEPMLDLPKEFIPELAPAACLRRWPGLDYGKYQTPFAVPPLPGESVIGTPTLSVLASNGMVDDSGGFTTLDETAAFTLANPTDAHFALIGGLGNTADYNMNAVTIGAQGRGAGAGTALTRRAYRRSGRAEAELWDLPTDLPEGVSTIIRQFAGTSGRVTRLKLVRVPGASGEVGAVNTAAATNTGGTITLTTTVPGSMILTLLCKQDGTPANRVTTTGLNVLLNDDSSAGADGGASNEAQYVLGYIPAPTAGAYAWQFTCPLSTAWVAIMVEILRA